MPHDRNPVTSRSYARPDTPGVWRRYQDKYLVLVHHDELIAGRFTGKGPVGVFAPVSSLPARKWKLITTGEQVFFDDKLLDLVERAISYIHPLVCRPSARMPLASRHRLLAVFRQALQAT